LHIYSVAVDSTLTVSSLVTIPSYPPRAALVLAHGAGAGMTHPFMADVAQGLHDRGIATLRFNFPYMERGSKRTDPPTLAHRVVRAAVAQAARLWPGVLLMAGGKSFGARMTSQAQAAEPLPGVHGLVFFGFPLHPAGHPSMARAEHLERVQVPMLFLQGTRDKLADLSLLRARIHQLRSLATLKEIEHADHSFHVLVRSGRTDAEVRSELFNAVASWITQRALEP
jgi:predicted alpha/beta-hydrolase family hydrolase